MILLLLGSYLASGLWYSETSINIFHLIAMALVVSPLFMTMVLYLWPRFHPIDTSAPTIIDPQLNENPSQEFTKLKNFAIIYYVGIGLDALVFAYVPIWILLLFVPIAFLRKMEIVRQTWLESHIKWLNITLLVIAALDTLFFLPNLTSISDFLGGDNLVISIWVLRFWIIYRVVKGLMYLGEKKEIGWW